MNNKDPAVLFYTSDFLTGVSDLTMEERGQYITLLCMQHQKGHLSEKTICLTVGNVSVDVMNKFKKDENGLYFNGRMEAESEKRSKYIESRVENGKKGGRKKSTSLASGKAYGKHKAKLGENGNENENINTNKDNILPYPLEEFHFGTEMEDQIHIWLKYKSERKESYKPTGFKTLLGAIKKQADEHGDQAVIDLINISMASNWQGIIWDKLVKKDKPKQSTGNYLDEVIKEGMQSESNRYGKDYETDPVTVPRLLQGSR
jgi:hypothetical protein